MSFNQLVSTYLEKENRIIKVALIMAMKKEIMFYVDERKNSKNRMLQR